MVTTWTKHSIWCLSFFAAGNILLLDGSNTILSVLRRFRPQSSESQSYEAGQVYPLNFEYKDQVVTREAILEAIASVKAKGTEAIAQEATITKKKFTVKRKANEPTLKYILTKLIGAYGPAIIGHCLSLAGIDPNSSLIEDLDEATVIGALKASTEVGKIVERCGRAPVIGYIYTRNDANVEDPTNLFDFQPFESQVMMSQGLKLHIYDDYNTVLDVYFTNLEKGKREIQAKAHSDALSTRISNVKTSHQTRLIDLQEEQAIYIRKAEAIQANLEQVEDCISSIKFLFDKGTDWVTIKDLVAREANIGNPIAKMIIRMKLEEHLISLALPVESNRSAKSVSDEDSDESDDDAPDMEDQDTIEVDVDFLISAHANAQRHFDLRRSALLKEKRTAASSKTAIKNSERKIKADFEKKSVNKPAKILEIRKPFWFEKFLWFISSDGFLVLSF